MPLLFFFAQHYFSIIGVLLDRCRIPGLDNDSFAVQNEHHQQLIDHYIPQISVDGVVKYSECNIFIVHQNLTRGKTDNETDKEQERCGSWVYDWSVFSSTAAAEVRNKFYS